jgi:hypothetical protein
MSPQSVESLLTLAIGFAVAGFVASAYQLVCKRPPSFSLLTAPQATAFAAIPLLVFAAPYIILRNTIRGRQIEGRRFEFVMLATIIAGFWSLMSGTFVMMALHALGISAS